MAGTKPPTDKAALPPCPLLPARAGDLVALGLGEAPPVLASVERRSNALVAVVGGDLGAIDLNDPRVASADRIAGMWFA